MQLRIHIKLPDCFSTAIEEHVDNILAQCPLTDVERRAIRGGRIKDLQMKLSRWLMYSECVEIDFDTDAGTATVVERAHR